MSLIPYNEENLTKIREVGETLLGTCWNLDTQIQRKFGSDDIQADHFDIKLLQELDDITMQCEDCGWWCETGELDDEQICDDCRRDY